MNTRTLSWITAGTLSFSRLGMAADGVELTAEEASLECRIGFIAPCVCRELTQLSGDPRLK
jgi:hypothetical protein